VLDQFPHDPAASTQGLEWSDGKLYESTGLWGESSLRRVELESGRVEQRVDLHETYFGEGVARVGRSLWQLTWRSGRAFRYDLDSLRRIGESRYEGQGWGLCFDGVDLWRTDGSDRLHRHDPETFAELDSIEVAVGDRPVTFLNELECAEGWIYANVWQSDAIVRIDPVTGSVMAVIDASGLLPSYEREGAGVLNGIAYRGETGTFLLTGKKWPRLFEVVFVETLD
jgi:glutaminyl-peptide cyclotransferase